MAKSAFLRIGKTSVSVSKKGIKINPMKKKGKK